jgi:hypothetical protein
MTGTTDALIGSLVRDARPVTPLPHPLLRAAVWIVAALLVAGFAVLVSGLRPDLPAHMAQPKVMMEWTAAILTGLLAAAAAFIVAIPGRSPAWALLPAPALLYWAGSIGYGCLTDWLRVGAAGFELGTSFGCFIAITLTSAPVVALLLYMLRHTARVRPRLTLGLGMLASSGLASAALTLYHHLDATIMVLIWHGGSIALLTIFATLQSRRLFAWVTPPRELPAV